ncbi:hypothetical protein FYK19_26475 (plasmid) [Escherichia albertii]|nr:hypothetical protein FYK19_26475 [Escherichia albertii]
MSPLTVLQYQIFNSFLIEYTQIFNQKYFIKLNKQLTQCSVKTLILWHSFSTYRDKPEGCGSVLSSFPGNYFPLSVMIWLLLTGDKLSRMAKEVPDALLSDSMTRARP